MPDSAQMLEAVKEIEQSDKRVLRLAVLVEVLVTAAYTSVTLLVWRTALTWWIVAIFAVWTLLFFSSTFLFTRILQSTGYFRCPHCQHIYKPSYKTVFFNTWGKKLYTQCPNCKKRGWHEKVLSKE